MKFREVRASYSDTTITVYQAYRAEIADAALAAGRFVPPFKRERMTWVKPSFLWMMYRCGWAEKPGQERVLAIEITRAGFEQALSEAVLSHYTPGLHTNRADWSRRVRRGDVRVQWDPERDLHLNELPYRSLQLGLTGAAVDRYVDKWITGLTEVTDLARTIHRTREADLLPAERPYPLPPEIAARLGG